MKRTRCYPEQSYCGCCGREIAGGNFCAKCGPHLRGSNLPAAERTFFAQHGKDCPFQQVPCKRCDGRGSLHGMEVGFGGIDDGAECGDCEGTGFVDAGEARS